MPARSTARVQHSGNGRLQYACTFPLSMPKNCAAGSVACDCSPTRAARLLGGHGGNSPLCQGGATVNTQTSQKGIPGARELQVLKDLGTTPSVASIARKWSLRPSERRSKYGYNPAVGANHRASEGGPEGQMPPRPIQTNDKGQVLCKVIEAQKTGCDCTAKGRAPADPTIITAVQTSSCRR